MAVFGDTTIISLTSKPKDSGIIGTSESDFIFIGSNNTDLYVEGNAGDDYIALDSGDDYILGGDGNDEILAGSGSNIVFGGAGDDLLSAGFDFGASNTFHGGDGNDTISTRSGDTAYGDAGNDIITSHGIADGGADNDIVSADIVYDSEGDDVVLKATTIHSSGAGNDIYHINYGLVNTINFAQGASGTKHAFAELHQGLTVNFTFDANDFLAFQDNQDHYIFQTATATYFLKGVNAIQFDGFSGPISVDLLDNIFPTGFNRELDHSIIDTTKVGTDGYDLIVGGFGNDHLSGGAGNDEIYAVIGNDYIDGGDGNDIVNFSYYISQVKSVEANIDGTINISVSSHTVTLENIEQVTFLNQRPMAVDNLIQSIDPIIRPFKYLKSDGDFYWVTPKRYTGDVAGVDFELLGQSSADLIEGSSGNDFINLLAGDDAAIGGDGSDILDGGVGSNFLTGGNDADTFYLDGRGGNITWSTITDFNGDVVNVWGWQEGVSKLLLTETSAGAAGYEGVTYHFDLNNDKTIDTSLTFTGLGAHDAPEYLASVIEGNGYLLFQ